MREIDRQNRALAVAGGGDRFSIRANDGIASFDQIEVGDRVNMTFTQSTSVAMAFPGDTRQTVVVSADAGRTPGQSRGTHSGQALSAMVTFGTYDLRTNDATLHRQDARLLITNVPVELRRFVAARQPGERVAVELIEAVATIAARHRERLWGSFLSFGRICVGGRPVIPGRPTEPLRHFSSMDTGS
ncbi:hypothetical protein [Aliiruegeria lutimaris]|uniref:Uncharacterized protein n=1 Tax=Aliiruegeria lutimaris TaxID=571298 RepID=A0A1G9AES4_9RHOB|nr:hypothetical protein [Aliiruegeria lutimaris]SDK25334.1 hypothetical protein SAMN04488026_103518 [Aliiruegeria lutimaris]